MVATSSEMNYDDGRNYCISLGLDYAKWKSFDEWKNIMHITRRSMSQPTIMSFEYYTRYSYITEWHPTWTSLKNPNSNSCAYTGCDGQAVKIDN